MATAREIEATKAAQILMSSFAQKPLVADGWWGTYTQSVYDGLPAEMRMAVESVLRAYGTGSMKLRASYAAEKATTPGGKATVLKTRALLSGGTGGKTLSSAERRFVELAKSAGLTPKATAFLMAQIRAESDFRPQDEAHGYRTPGRAQKTFSAMSRLSDEQVRALVARGPAAFFEVAYGVGTPRGKDLGNVSPGDGGRYFGRGLLQITGRANYLKYGNAIGVNLINDPEALVRDFDTSARVAIAYYKDRVKGSDSSITVEGVTGAVAGRHVVKHASVDLPKRKQYSEEYLSALA